MNFKILSRLGIRKSQKPVEEKYPADFTEYEISIIEKIKGLTMTSPERIVSLIRSMQYIIENNIPGDIVECGVWRGGNAIVISKILQDNNIIDRNIWLYDTFQGMTDPSNKDTDYLGSSAVSLLNNHKGNEDSLIWAYCSLENVKQNLINSGCDLNNIKFIKGDVLKTIPERLPTDIAVLRLDTDWYESTKHELIYMFPKVSKGGITIIDDFGHWEGAKKATLEYFEENLQTPVFLHRIDMTGRLILKN